MAYFFLSVAIDPDDLDYHTPNAERRNGAIATFLDAICYAVFRFRRLLRPQSLRGRTLKFLWKTLFGSYCVLTATRRE